MWPACCAPLNLVCPPYLSAQADNEQLEASLAAANAQVSKLQQQLASLSELQEGLQASLQGKQSAEASLMSQLTQVGPTAYVSTPRPCVLRNGRSSKPTFAAPQLTERPIELLQTAVLVLHIDLLIICQVICAPRQGVTMYTAAESWYLCTKVHVILGPLPQQVFQSVHTHTCTAPIPCMEVLNCPHTMLSGTKRCSCCCHLLQTRAKLDAAEASVAALSADKAQLQQDLSSTRDKVMLLESELKLKASRMDAAQQQLASEVQEHQAKQALLQKQLEQLKVMHMCCRTHIDGLAHTTHAL